MADERYISLRAYARHRDVALSAVQKAIATGRVTAVKKNERNGRIVGVDPVAADQQWSANTDPVEAMRNGQLPGAPGAGATSSSGALPLDAPAANGGSAERDDVPTAGGDQGEYLAARAKREGFLAKQAELNYLQQIGLLVSAAAVEKEIAEIFTQVKTSVMRIADRKAQILAAEADPLKVHRILSEEFRTAFDELSSRFAADAAGGAEEPETALS